MPQRVQYIMTKSIYHMVLSIIEIFSLFSKIPKSIVAHSLRNSGLDASPQGQEGMQYCRLE